MLIRSSAPVPCLYNGRAVELSYTAQDNSVYNIVCLCASLSAKVWIQFTPYYSIQHGACSRASPLSYLWSSPQTHPTHHVEKVSGVYILVLDLKIEISKIRSQNSQSMSRASVVRGHWL